MCASAEALTARSVEPEMSVGEAVADFLFECRIRGLSPKTLAMYEDQLRHLERFCAGRGITLIRAVGVGELRALVATRLGQVKPISVHALQRVLSALFGYMTRAGVVVVDPMRSVAKVRLGAPEPRCLTDAELLAALGAPDRSTFVGLRDYALMLTLYDGMLRVSEALDLVDGDLDLATGEATVRSGKGGKARRVHLGRRSLAAIKQLLGRRGAANGPYLFCSQFGERMNGQSVARRFREYGKAAGLSPGRCTPHAFRHTGATAFIRNGGDALVLQRILGHTSLDMTRRYVSMAAADIIDAHVRASPADGLSGVRRRAIR